MDWSFLDVLWTMFIFFAWVVWFWLLITVFGDLFGRRDVGAGMKVVWTGFVIVLPFLGTFVYLISQGRGMEDRRRARSAAGGAQMDEHARSVAGTAGGAAAEIERGKRLLDDGAITQAEYEALKTRALAGLGA